MQPSHSILTPGLLVPALILQRRESGRIATGAPYCVNVHATAPTASLHRVKLSQLRHSAAENCLCRKLTETQWGLLSVASLWWNGDSTSASNSSPESLSAAN